MSTSHEWWYNDVISVRGVSDGASQLEISSILPGVKSVCCQRCIFFARVFVRNLNELISESTVLISTYLHIQYTVIIRTYLVSSNYHIRFLLPYLLIVTGSYYLANSGIPAQPPFQRLSISQFPEIGKGNFPKLASY